MLVIHGHELDVVVQNIRWLAHLGDVGYGLLLRLNAPLNWIRKVLGLHYWSLSAAAKRQIKTAVNYIGAFEEAVGRLVKLEENVQGVVCGHIHTPALRWLDNLEYCNSGDWVESLSALVEEEDGALRLLFYNTMQQSGPGATVTASA